MIPSTWLHARWMSVLLLVLTGWMPTGAAELTISQVQPDRLQADPAKRERVTVRFRLNEAAKASLQIFDGRDLLIREIGGAAILPAGEHALTWDLRDARGKAVPPEAYSYVVAAGSAAGAVVRYDLTDQTGGETLAPQQVQWDPNAGQLSYVLEKPARVSIRIGLNEGGPLLRTLLDWVVRPAGVREERWNGKDASGVLSLERHPRLVINVQAFSLPENTILVGDPPLTVALVDSQGRVSRPKTAARPKRMYAHEQQPLETRGDFKIELQLPASTPRSASGLPIIAAITPVRLTIDPKDRDRAVSRRFEPVFFLDGQFAFENETGFVPMTWNFDPTAINAGEHFITVNLRGYEGNFGMATLKVLVQRGPDGTTAAGR